MNTTMKVLLTALTVICLLGIFPATVMADQVTDDTLTIGVEFDNELNSRMPDNVRKSFGYIDIGVSKFYGNETTRYIAKIDVSSLDPSREIESAIFKIDRVSSTWDRDNNYYLCLVDETWNTNSVAWNNQPNFGGTGIEGIYTSYGIFEFDFTDLVKGWDSNSDSNNGFLIMKTYEQDIKNELIAGEANRGQFASINYSISGGETRPYLEVSYATQKMEPISDLYAQAKGPKVSLTWTLPAEAIGTNVYRNSEEEFEFLASTTGTYTIYLDRGVSLGDYIYMVRWVNEKGMESPDSNLAKVSVTGGRR